MSGVRLFPVYPSPNINALNAVNIYIYGHIKLPVIAATIYIYALDKFVCFPREAKKLNEF